MFRIHCVAGIVLLLAMPALAGNAQQQSIVLTLQQALDRARESSPGVVAARMQVEEARGRLAGASLLLSSNPSVDVEAGSRRGEIESTDYSIAIGQELDLPRRRSARIDAARAVVLQDQAGARDVERQALASVAIAFLRALEARERLEAATASRGIAGEALGIAQRRYAAGDVAQLDVNLARTAVARSEAEARGAEATLKGYLTELQVLIGSAQPVSVAGSLHDPAFQPPDDALARAAERPDLRRLDSEIAEAEAEQRLASTLRWPDVGLRASYAKEGLDEVVQGGIGVTLPVFDRGQEAAAVASARLARLRTQRQALAQSIEAHVRGALATYEAMSAAAEDYERTVVPLIEENERLALESYDIGQIGLAELLVVRREALEARRSLIDLLMATRLVEIELRARGGF